MKKLFRMIFVTTLLILCGLYLLSVNFVFAQDEVDVQCGGIVPGEFTDKDQTFKYSLTVKSGAKADLLVQPIDDYLLLALYLDNAKEANIGYDGWSNKPHIISGTLSRGIYKIRVINGNASLGEFKLLIGCTLPDGRIVKPGDNSSTSTDPASASSTGPDSSQESSVTRTQAETPSDIQPFIEIDKSYEFEYGTQTKIMKVLEVRSDGWIKVEYDEKWSWLNLSHVVLITPVEE